MAYPQFLLAYINHASVLPPLFYLVVGVAFVAWGLKNLYDWHSLRSRQAQEPSQHLSSGQEKVRAKFAGPTPRDKMAGALSSLLMAAFLIGLYLIINRA